MRTHFVAKCYRKMIEINENENTRKRTSIPDDQPKKFYKSLDVYVFSSDLKLQKVDRKFSKKRKIEIKLECAQFPDDLEESFYCGGLHNQSFAHDQTVPGGFSKVENLEQGMYSEDPIGTDSPVKKTKPQQPNHPPKTPCLLPSSKSTFLKTPKLQETQHLDSETLRLVPETPYVRTPMGHNHRVNSGFMVPETPAFLLPNLPAKTTSVVQETPFLP